MRSLCTAAVSHTLGGGSGESRGRQVKGPHMSSQLETLNSSIDEVAALFDVQLNDAPAPVEEREALKAAPKFGTVFSDHMARVTWKDGEGWTARRVEKYGPLQLDPAAAVLHYGQEIFEGLKAYRHADGSVWSFRPEENARRYIRSARRLALPELSVDDFIGSIAALVRTDIEWIPTGDEAALYLRPFMIATEAFLGVRPALEAEHLVIASPVGPYFSGGVHPVNIWISQDYARASRGGTGEAKCGGNYAASLLPQIQAAREGFDQVCFLDGQADPAIEELGGMNVFFVKANGDIVTPALSGSILRGVTRSSILQLIKDRDINVTEEHITLASLKAMLESGEITEAFACGTAAVITPIGRLADHDFDVTINGGEPGKTTMDIREELTDIQNGRRPDRHGWLTRLA